MTLSGGSSSRISTEIPSFAMIANFNMIRQRSHRKGDSSVGFSQKGSIPRSARSLVADCAYDILDCGDKYLSHRSA